MSHVASPDIEGVGNAKARVNPRSPRLHDGGLVHTVLEL